MNLVNVVSSGNPLKASTNCLLDINNIVGTALMCNYSTISGNLSILILTNLQLLSFPASVSRYDVNFLHCSAQSE